jgi:hypothetical protein
MQRAIHRMPYQVDLAGSKRVDSGQVLRAIYINRPLLSPTLPRIANASAT